MSPDASLTLLSRYSLENNQIGYAGGAALAEAGSSTGSSSRPAPAPASAALLL